MAGRPVAVRPPTPALAWTALVVAAGVVLAGHVSATALLAMAVVAGLPHGATDLDAADRRFRSMGRAWWAPFLLGYLFLVTVTLALWAALPIVMLTVFLLLSIVHFGKQDGAGPAGRPAWAAVLAHGGAPIVVPAIAHPAEVVRLFATMVADRADVVQALVAGPVAAAWMIAAGVTMLRGIRQGQAALPHLADLALVCALFVAAPPLVAFALYFALLHTPRAFAAQAAAADPMSPQRMVVLTLLACVLGAGIYWYASPLALDENVVRSCFVLLSALTVPHMALDWVMHVSPNKLPLRQLRMA